MFVINDIDVDTKVLALNKIIDKSPVTDSFLRERGVLSYPTKYQMEKLSITIGYDLSVESHRNDFAELSMEVDEYPFVFVRSEKVKSLMFQFTEQQTGYDLTTTQVFMVSKISASIDAELKDFVTLNIVLHPYNVYAIIDSFSFLSYVKNDDGTFTITSGVEGPKESLIYQDFFSSRKAKVKEKINSFIGSNKISDVRILSPFFTKIKPESSTCEIEFEEISYTDSGGENPVTEDGNGNYKSTGEQYESFLSYRSDGTIEDKYKKKMYVYWKGDIFTSDQISDNAVTSIEVVRNNNIVQQPISGHAFPVIQYMGKREGYFNISFISKSGENTSDGKISTLYTMFKILLEKYNYNLLMESRFAGYNIFKIKSVLTSIFDLNGYVPAQVFLQNNSSNKTDDYSVTFIESSPFDLKNLGKGKIEKQKDQDLTLGKLIETVRVVDSNISASNKLDSKYKNIKYEDLLRLWRMASLQTTTSIAERINITIDKFILSEPKDSSELIFIKDFYTKLSIMMRAYSDNDIGIEFNDTTTEFLDTLQYKLGTDSETNSDGEVISKKELVVSVRRLLVDLAEFISRNMGNNEFITDNIRGTTNDISVAVGVSEFKNFKYESVPDLKLGESLGMIDGNSYLGVDDPRKITCAPFLTWAPLLTESEIKEEYLKTKDEIDKFYNEIYDKSKLKIEDAALLVAKGKLTVDRGDPGVTMSDSTDTTAALLSVAPATTAIVTGVMNGIASLFSSDAAATPPGQINTGPIDNLIEWIGSKDAGATGFEALNTVFCMRTEHGLDLTKMTVAQVMAKQPEWSEWSRRNVGRCNEPRGSHATGKYQAMHDSLQEAINSGVIKKSDLFDERTQNKFGFWAGTIKSGRRKLANSYTEARNAWKAGKLSYYEYALKRNAYHNSLTNEWAAILRTDNSKTYGKQGYITAKEMGAAMDQLPLFSAALAKDAPGVASKLTLPFELAGTAAVAQATATVSEVTPTGQTLPPGETQTPSIDPKTAEEQFVARYSGAIPTASGTSPVGMEVSGTVPSIQETTTDGNAQEDKDLVNQLMKKLGVTTDYTVFDHDVNVQIQAKDGTAMFRNGFNMSFPTVKAYIVFGGSNDNQNKYSPHKPNYIELSGLLECNITLNDTDNPVDVAYLQLANPGRVYTDQAMFWESFKPKMDYKKIGTSEELRFLVDMMMVNPGNRLHIKAGYGNDPNKLETVFNGEITSVDDSETLIVVAEGYGRELIMLKHGQEKGMILSSNFNSGTRESIAHMLIEFEEIQNLGRRARSIMDYFVAGFFKVNDTVSLSNVLASVPAAVGVAQNGEISAGIDEPESREVSGADGSDDSFSWARFGSNFWEIETAKKQPLLKNIYAEEVTMVDEEFQYNFWNFLDINRASRNFLIMFDHTTWSIMDSIMHRHPNTLAKPMFYENEMTLFYGIKDQCYIANGVNERVQTEAASGFNRETYEREKYRRYKAVSQTHIVSSGVNLISNRMKVNSDFYTKVNVLVSDISILGDNMQDGGTGHRMTEERYWDSPELLQMQYDDNLRPNMIRDTEIRINGCDSLLAAVRFGTKFLTDEVSKMYDGEIAILGNEKVKNGDVVFLNDMQRGLMGFVEVSECRHYYGSTSGFTTVFRPLLFAEARYPYFTNLGKKTRVAFIRAFIGILSKIATNANKSDMFAFLNMTVDQLGATHSPGDYSWFPLQTMFKNITHGNQSEAAILEATTALGAIFSSYLIGSGIGSAGAIASSSYQSFVAGSRSLLGNRVVDGAKWLSEGMSTMARNAAASAVEALAARGVMGSLGAQLTKGITRVFYLALENPVTALIVAATALVSMSAFASLERFRLTRDPIEITPLLIFGKPYLSGITGARNDGWLLDTLGNFNSSLVNLEKVWRSNTSQAAILYSRDLVSPFDKDYVEY